MGALAPGSNGRASGVILSTGVCGFLCPSSHLKRFAVTFWAAANLCLLVTFPRTAYNLSKSTLGLQIGVVQSHQLATASSRLTVSQSEAVTVSPGLPSQS